MLTVTITTANGATFTHTSTPGKLRNWAKTYGVWLKTRRTPTPGISDITIYGDSVIKVEVDHHEHASKAPAVSAVSATRTPANAPKDVVDSDDQPITLGAHVAWQGAPKGHVFDIETPKPYGFNSGAGVVWVRDDQGLEYAFDASVLTVIPEAA